MAIIIENKQYHENSSPEEINAIKDRVIVSRINPRIIIFNELPNPSPFSVKMSFGRIKELTKDFDSFALIVNVEDCGRPDAISRRCINDELAAAANLKFFTVTTGKNKIITAAIRIALYGFSAKKNYKIASNLNEAIQITHQNMLDLEN